MIVCICHIKSKLMSHPDKRMVFIECYQESLSRAFSQTLPRTGFSGVIVWRRHLALPSNRSQHSFVCVVYVLHLKTSWESWGSFFSAGFALFTFKRNECTLPPPSSSPLPSSSPAPTPQSKKYEVEDNFLFVTSRTFIHIVKGRGQSRARMKEPTLIFTSSFLYSRKIVIFLEWVFNSGRPIELPHTTLEYICLVPVVYSFS